MELCRPLRIIPCVPEENGAIFFHIMNPLFTKLVILSPCFHERGLPWFCFYFIEVNFLVM